MLPRITGLDPARPCFNEGEKLHALQRGDASFIDVIHSNSGILGVKVSIGDVDFYPNGYIFLIVFYKYLNYHYKHIVVKTHCNQDVGQLYVLMDVRMNILQKQFIPEKNLILWQPDVIPCKRTDINGAVANQFQWALQHHRPQEEIII